MNDDTDQRGNYDYVWSHALISDETYRGLIDHCLSRSKNSSICENYEERIGREAGKIDFYNIYSAVCPHSSNSSSSSSSSSSSGKMNGFGGYDPCEEDYVRKYLNRHGVQEALHANTTTKLLPYTWELCRFLS
ncbi:hypothetical protein U1Q18_003945 [Sarracenia purpurea var. burkii]